MSKISEYPAAATADGTEVSPAVQGGITVRGTWQAIANLFKGTKGTDIASATTTDIGAATGVFVHITGTTTITGLGTVAAGAMRWVRFSGALTLTHNATSLILPSAANIITAADDSALFVSEGSGNWVCLGYWRKSGQPLVASAAAVNVQNVTSASTITPTFSNDIVRATAQAAGLTLANPTGTAVDGWGIVVELLDNGTARSLTFGTQYRGIGGSLPTTTVAGKRMVFGMVFNNADTKWDVILPVAQEA
jgi:hypothetical protein